jgi:NAD-dependent deacetylase
VVLYEEGLDQQTVEGAVHAIARADCLIVAGTSLSVYPAAGFIRYFQGDHFVLINRDPTPADKLADLVLHQKVGQVLSQIQVR